MSSRALRIAAAVTACVALATGAANVASARPGVTVAAGFNRSLGLAGAANARDVGGYHTADGRTVRTGLVFRSNALNALTPADLASLTHRDLRVVEDLRTSYERAVAPDKLPAGAVGVWNDVLGQAPISAVLQPANAYDQFIATPASRAVGNVLRDIAHTDGGLLYHCSAGKDRTGWTTAVLLTVLGVDRATVNQDFLLSNRYLHAAPGDEVTGVTVAELNTAFGAADRQYGSFANYIHRGLGLSDGDIAALKAKLLA